MNSLKYSKIISSVDILKELKHRNIKYKISNNNALINCPFHHDRHPSLGILLETKNKRQLKGYWQCQSFNCSEKGNFISFIAKVDDVKYKDIVKRFNRQAKIDKRIIKSLKLKFRKNIKSKIKVKLKIIKPSIFESYKKPYGKFLKYLKGSKRKLTSITIKKFNIKCCDEGVWKNRVIIPVYDLKSNLVSLVARSILKNVDKTMKIRKLKNTDRSKVLFGLNYIKDKKLLYLVEGEFDAIYLQQNSIPAVSIGCKNVSEDQRKLLVEYADKIYINFDGDVSRKVLRQKRRELEKYIDVEILQLPENTDPNELTKKQISQIYKDV